MVSVTATPRRWALTTACACGILLVLVYLLAVRTAAGQHFEDSVLNAAELRQDSLAAGLATRALNTVTVLSLATALAGVVVIAWLRRLPVLGWLAAGVVAASVVSGQLLRVVVERPVLLDFGIRRGDQSFPSGHAAVALSVMCALGLVVPSRWRPLTIGVGFIWATSVTAGTVLAGWHRPSDTAGSGLIVLFWTSLAVAVLARPVPLAPGMARAGRAWGKRPSPFRRAGELACLAVPMTAVTSIFATTGGFRYGELIGDPLAAGYAIAWFGSVVVAIIALVLPPHVDRRSPSAPSYPDSED